MIDPLIKKSILALQRIGSGSMHTRHSQDCFTWYYKLRNAISASMRRITTRWLRLLLHLLLQCPPTPSLKLPVAIIATHNLTSEISCFTDFVNHVLICHQSSVIVSPQESRHHHSYHPSLLSFLSNLKIFIFF